MKPKKRSGVMLGSGKPKYNRNPEIVERTKYLRCFDFVKVNFRSTVQANQHPMKKLSGLHPQSGSESITLLEFTINKIAKIPSPILRNRGNLLCANMDLTDK